MTGKIASRYAEFLASRSKLVILAILLLTVVVTAGVTVGADEQAGVGGFQVNSTETQANDYVQDNYGTDNRTVSQVVVREENGDVLTRESLLEGLRLQQEIRNNETLNGTLSEPGFVGIENLAGTVAAIRDEGGEQPGQPSLAAQIAALESRSDEEVNQLLTELLDPEAELPVDEDPYQLLPTSYEPGETSADARLILMFQVDESGDDAVPQESYDAQVSIAGLIDERFDDAFIFGQGINDDASNRATGDSFAIITPVALVLVIFVLGISYRDVLDILLAIFGIIIVLLWQAGIQGWLQIPMNVILIAVPFLLIGLSIDYALHVVMRYRESREGTLDGDGDGEPATDGGEDVDDTDDTGSEDEAARGIRPAMTLGLGSVVLALAAATFSTGVGFLSNVVSPLPAIRDFAILSAGGILATFVVFAILLPALKIEVDGFVENRIGWSRRKPAFGVESGLVNSGLERLAAVTSKAPVAVLVVALLLASGGALGATTIDTEFNQADFLPEDSPGWTEYLPGPLEPGDYTIKDNFNYLNENFQLQDQNSQSQVLIRNDGEGPAIDGQTLTAIDTAGSNVDEDSAIQRTPTGEASLEGPNTVIRDIAAQDETVEAAIEDWDTNDDGLPDENLDQFYEILFDADEEAASEVLSRNEEGQVTSGRLLISVRSTESAQTIADDTGEFASEVESESGRQVNAVATGPTVVTAVTQDALLETLIQGFIVTLVVILLFLTVLFYVQYGTPSYGLVLITPVVASLCWLLGAMALLGIPFNSETGIITSLAIGLGVDYSIHAGERFVAERERRETLDETLQATITGTGGALLASAGTTAAGFGVLGLSLSPPLQRFGIVTGSAIVLAFVSCVTVLPCLLVVRERLKRRYSEEPEGKEQKAASD